MKNHQNEGGSGGVLLGGVFGVIYGGVRNEGYLGDPGVYTIKRCPGGASLFSPE